MSNSLIKSYSVNYQNKDEKKTKRVIDSNQAVSERIKALSEILESVAEEDLADDFNEGLDVEQVDALLADQEELAAEKERNEAAQKLIDDANTQAEEIIADANARAAEIIEEANAKAVEIGEEAKRAGHAEGDERGYNEGLERAAQIEREAEAKAAELDRQYEEKLEELEPKIVHALTDIYSHVFGIDLTGRSDVVLHLLKDTISNIDGAKNYLVHVSRDDHEAVVAGKDELMSGLGSSATVEIIEDATLSPGNSFIETDSGIFDCAIGTELELLKKELRILSYGS